MQITRQADYAIRAVRFLAQQDGGDRIATSMVAKKMEIPPSFLAKIISQLHLAGLLHTWRGASGGITLAKPAKEITLLEVIEAIDGPILLNECVGDPGGCTFTEEWPMHSIWSETQKQLVDRLRATKFSTLI